MLSMFEHEQDLFPLRVLFYEQRFSVSSPIKRMLFSKRDCLLQGFCFDLQSFCCDIELESHDFVFKSSEFLKSVEVFFNSFAGFIQIYSSLFYLNAVSECAFYSISLLLVRLHKP